MKPFKSVDTIRGYTTPLLRAAGASVRLEASRPTTISLLFNDVT